MSSLPLPLLLRRTLIRRRLRCGCSIASSPFSSSTHRAAAAASAPAAAPSGAAIDEKATTTTSSSSSSSSSSSPSPRLQELRSRIRTKEGGPSLQDFLRQQQQQQQHQTIPVPQPAPLQDDEELRHTHTHAHAPTPATTTAPLTDSFGRKHTYLRISLTERCNLRCTYCMPAEGIALQPSDRLLTTDEILRLAELFVEQGVTKIRLTGGEPLIRKDIVPLTRSLKALGLTEVAVTTNGVSPGSRFEELVAAGMTHVNVSLDTLIPEKFERISRRPAKYLEIVRGNLGRLLGPLGLGGRVKVNNVVMRGVNDDELSDFVALTEGERLDVRFIEWMPFDSNGWNGSTFVSYQEMLTHILKDFSEIDRAQDAPNDTTKWYRVPGHQGRVGFITSMSQHFCGSCNRLRITADGKLKVCLFGAEDLSLRDALREGKSREELVALVGRAVGGKKFSLGGQEDMFALAKSKNRPMILIGG